MATFFILIVEDDCDTGDLLQLVLQQEGFETAVVRSGERALQAIQARRPGLVITDLRIPAPDGVQLIRQLKGRSEFDGLPVVVFSAYSDQEGAEAIAAGATVVLRKPHDFPRLLDTVNRLLAPTGAAPKLD